MSTSTASRRTLSLSLLGLVLLVLALSAIGPKDTFTWLLEVAPVLIGVPVVLLTRKRFPLTPLLMLLLAMHAVILIVGGHYTYAEVPAGDWLKEALSLSRNPYDRLGHLAQGFIPAILARELLVRRSPLGATSGAYAPAANARRWLFLCVTSICLAFSAFYEFIEWWTALASGEAAEAFLGTQGDVWDTQWDMFCALIGATTAQLLLSRVHDRQLAQLSRPDSSP